MNVAKLADVLKKANISKIRYFHTDHFEPWSKGVNEDTARGVDNFAKQSKESRFAAKLSLFYHTFLPFGLDQKLVQKDEPGIDAVVFGERSELQNRLAKRVMRPLETDGTHEFHIHVHHESWTRNTEEYSKDISRWVNTHSNAELDSSRLERAVIQTKQYIAQDIGRPIERWAFVHGNWALNGSDRTICWIEDEIGILMKHGCFGDFTFPAGRGHCNPTILEEPYTCLPVIKPKGYDLPESQPLVMKPGSKAFQTDRFFIWNSVLKANFASLDYYSEGNRETFKNTELVVQNWLEKGVLLEDTLYIKTHAHSMKWEYEIDKGVNPIPHLYPDIKEIFLLLERVCEKAGVELEVLTVNEVMTKLGELTSSEYVEVPKPIRLSPLQESISALGEAMTAWLDGSDSRNLAAGEFYTTRITTKCWLEKYELATIEHILKKYDPDLTRVSEIGCGLGTLTLVLAALGYEVYGIEGDFRRSEGAKWIRDFLASRYPDLTKRYTIVEGFYPNVLTKNLIESGKTNILISTNLINTFSAQNQDRILKSGLLFDRLIMDTSRFGKYRRSADTRSTIEHSLSQHFQLVDSCYQSNSDALMEFAPRDPLAVNFENNHVLSSIADVVAISTEVCTEWLAEQKSTGATDTFVEAKLLRKQLIDNREESVIKQMCNLFDPGTTRVVEVGSACGALALGLATQGFEVIGFEGNTKRAGAAELVKAKWIEKFPESKASVLFVAELFPKGYRDNLVSREKRNVLLITNIVGTYSAENQAAILAAAANFDDVVIDLGRFGIDRNSAEQRSMLLQSMATSHFRPVKPLYINLPNECWHFEICPIIQQEVASRKQD